MALKVTHDGTGPGDVCERCCMCRIKTRHWYAPADVALCQECAKTTRRYELPTKAEWCAKEEALDPSLVKRPMWS